MDTIKLEVTKKKYTGESIILSVRMPKSMLSDVDALAASTGRSRNELINTSVEFALKHLVIKEPE